MSAYRYSLPQGVVCLQKKSTKRGGPMPQFLQFTFGVIAFVAFMCVLCTFGWYVGVVLGGFFLLWLGGMVFMNERTTAHTIKIVSSLRSIGEAAFPRKD